METQLPAPSASPGPAPVWETVIRPRRHGWGIDWREHFAYRDLLWLLVRRDFVAKYKQTLLGPLWFVLQPLLTTVVFTVIFGRIARIPTDGTPPVLFYLCGLLGWTYFAQTFSAVAGTFTANANLFGKVYFPRLVLPVSAVLGNAFALVLNFVIFAGFWCYYRFGTDALAPAANLLTGAVWFPLLALQTAAVSLACGLWMAVLTAKYRDLTHLTGFLVQLWLYVTPVIYPLSQVTGAWRWIAGLNPMACVVEAFRSTLLGTGSVPPQMVASSLAVTLVLLVSALVAFRHTERRFIDTV